jgi:hypothetical protein
VATKPNRRFELPSVFHRESGNQERSRRRQATLPCHCCGPVTTLIYAAEGEDAATSVGNVN